MNDARDLDAIDARMAALPTAALLRELEAVVIAIDDADPVRRRRRAGFFGRLIGRDLVAQAQPDPADTRVRLHLSSAEALAVRLEAQVAELEPLSPLLHEQAERLRDTTDAANGPHDATRAAAMAAMRDTAAAQLALVCRHARALLERHAQVRDVLVPAWRRHSALAGASAYTGAEADARLRESLRAQLDALRRALGDERAPFAPSRNALAATGTDRPSKEPSP
ncbi:MAG TPA: hypothetical protein VGD42_08020 [Lysobacter sp.]